MKNIIGQPLEIEKKHIGSLTIMQDSKIGRIESSERGQSLVEVAISFMVLVLILVVAVEGGRIFSSFIAVRDAAEEGALHAIYNPGDSAGIEARVRTTSSDPINLSDTGLVSVSSVLNGSPCAGNTTTVTVTYTFTITMPFIGAILGSQSFPLSADAISTIVIPEC